MGGLRRWAGRLFLPFSVQSDQAIADEIRSHVSLHADELIAAGQPPHIARRNALISLGGAAQTLDRCRDHRRFSSVVTFGRDIRLAARRLWRDPSFTVAAVITLALGIGASSAIFSAARATLARPLPYGEPERQVRIFSRWTAFEKISVADQEIYDYRSMARTLSAVCAWFPSRQNLTGAGQPSRLSVGNVTANTFEVLGVVPLLGRGFTIDEDRPKGPPVAVLGYDLWRDRFNADPSILGRRIVLDDAPVEVVGVMPAGFRLPSDYTDDVTEPSQLWRPAQIDEAQLSRSHSYHAAARLAPGQTARTASDELASIARQLTERGEYRVSMHFSAFARPLDDEIRGELRPVMWLLTGGVICLLLSACANVGNLLLVRGEVRQRELSLRAALGASRSRLLRDLLLEALLLAAAATAAGLPLAFAGLAVVRAFDPDVLEALAPLAVHWPMVLVAAVAATLTTVLFSAAPIIGHERVSRILRDTGSRATGAATRARLRRTLVLVEVGVATVLLITAGLIFRSLDAMRRVDLGFEPRNLLTMPIALPQSRYGAPEQVVDFYRRLSEEARALPGVEAAGAVRLLPLASTIGDWGSTSTDTTKPRPTRRETGRS